MRYLRKYNESSENDSVKQTVKDILLPISDMNYDISVTGDNENLVIRVVSWGDQSLLINDEVKEEFMRMKDYLESEGFNSIEVLYHLETPGAISSRDIKEFGDFMKFEPWQGVKIQNLLFVAK